MRLAIVSLLVGASACSGGERVEPRQHIDAPADPTFSLYVSNQSFDLDPVDIRIRIDDQLAVTGDFVVEGQHTWLVFDFDLAPGTHTLEVSTADVAEVELDMPFVMDERKYGVVNFWFYEDGPEPTPPSFSFNLLDEPPLFL